jgi:hypothetical protein
MRKPEKCYGCHRILPECFFRLGAEIACETYSVFGGDGKVYGKLCYRYLSLLKDIPTG